MDGYNDMDGRLNSRYEPHRRAWTDNPDRLHVDSYSQHVGDQIQSSSNQIGIGRPLGRKLGGKNSDNHSEDNNSIGSRAFDYTGNTMMLQKLREHNQQMSNIHNLHNNLHELKNKKEVSDELVNNNDSQLDSNKGNPLIKSVKKTIQTSSSMRTTKADDIIADMGKDFMSIENDMLIMQNFNSTYHKYMQHRPKEMISVIDYSSERCREDAMGRSVEIVEDGKANNGEDQEDSERKHWGLSELNIFLFLIPEFLS